jgi:phosphonate transport system permease protein
MEARPALRMVRPVGDRRRAWVGAGLATVAVAVATAVAGASGIVNSGGWPQVRAFLVASVHPELNPQFLRLTWESTLTTVAYAVLATLLAMALGLVGGVLLAETWWRRSPHPAAPPRPGWYVARGLVSVPRGVHEAVWGLLLVSVLGLDPLVAILAIGIPFGAISAKVVGELVDEVAGGAYLALRVTGAGRVAALLYGVLPVAGADIVSYGFYRLECALRAAAILGIIGAGGLGFQLALSFQALRYEEMWTLTYALVAVSGLADLWSSRLRRRTDHDTTTRVTRPAKPVHRAFRGTGTHEVSLALAAVLVVAALAHLDVDVSALWSPDARRLAARTAREAWPPSVEGTGMAGLVRLSVDTVQMSVIGIAAATAAAVPVAFVAARGGGRLRGAASVVARALLLVSRAVPPPVWAFVLLLVLFPGVLPGATALAVYNFGILGRLMAEVVENLDERPALALRTLGAPDAHAFLYAVLPEATPRFAAYALYRWEVALRETVIVGLVGAGGLGRLLAEQLAAFDRAGALTTVIALIVLSAAVDLVSAAARRSLR